MQRARPGPSPSSYPSRGGLRRARGLAWLALAALSLGACAGAPEEASRTATQPSAMASAAASGPTLQAGIRQVAHKIPVPERPRVVTPQKRLQCVPYAREHSKIEIRGDAWTWWDQAKGRFQRSRVPAVGAVLVLRRKGASRGHLAVVSQIVNDREIIANHANWLNQGRIHIGTPVRDVSPDNDWSSVRVWYTPGNVLGKSAYPAYGFIYPPTSTATR